MGRYNLKNDRRNKKYEHDELDVTRLMLWPLVK